jgi:ATP-dependent DNA ligase
MTAARRAPAVHVHAPMKATDLKQMIPWGTERQFDAIGAWLTPEWVAEPKYDGVRAFLQLLPGRSRFGGTRSESFPDLAAVHLDKPVTITVNGERMRFAGLAGTVLDGELIAAPPGERAPVNITAGWFGSGRTRAAMYRRIYGRPTFYVFDITHLAGIDITAASYDQRRAVLAQVVKAIVKANPGCGIVLVPQLPATAAAIAGVLDAGGEGVMLKRRTGRYEPCDRPGQRSKAWAKVKAMATVDVVLTGAWLPGTGRTRVGTVGSVEIAVIGADGGWQVVGHCAVTPELLSVYTPADMASLAGTVWEVMCAGVTAGGKLRHPHLVRVREDKRPEWCPAAQLDALPAAA